MIFKEYRYSSIQSIATQLSSAQLFQTRTSGFLLLLFSILNPNLNPNPKHPFELLSPIFSFLPPTPLSPGARPPALRNEKDTPQNQCCCLSRPACASASVRLGSSRRFVHGEGWAGGDVFGGRGLCCWWALSLSSSLPLHLSLHLSFSKGGSRPFPPLFLF